MPALLEREEYNAGLIARGFKPQKLPAAWTNRPKLTQAESALWADFQELAGFCGGEVRPADAEAWFRMHELGTDEVRWLLPIYARLAAAWRTPPEASKTRA